MKILAPFGPKIAKFKISKSIIKRMNDEVEKISRNRRLEKKYNYSKKLVGHVSKEIELSKNFINKNLKKIISSSVKNFIKKTCGKNTSKIKIKNLWVVSQYSSEFNPVHYHSGHISGVGYLKVPSNFGEYSQKTKTENYNGALSLVHGSRMFNSPATFNVKPKVGDFYFFPNYLMHVVYPFSNSNDERRSISFNAFIDEKIYNPYDRN